MFRVFFFKQKTAYELRISDWSSDVCSSDLPENPEAPAGVPAIAMHPSTELRGYADIPDQGPLDEATIHRLLQGYYAGTSYIDAQIGRLLDEQIGRASGRERVCKYV